MELAPSLPLELTDAVMRLLAKSPLERFASVEAFERAVAGHLGSSEPGRAASTRPGRLRPVAISFSTRLHGHHGPAHEVRDRIRGVRIAPAIVFVEGDAGSGKTTLLDEVQRLEVHAQFCRGGFTPSGAAQLLGGWTSALVDLANVVLTSRTGELEVWRARILGQLGDWAPLIAALAPEWQTILRCPSSTTHDPLDTSLNRLALAIHRLFGCYADDESPLVLVLEDLQWADAPSLRMLELILTAPEPLSLLVLAAVRDGGGAGGEVAVVHALGHRLRSAGTDVASVRLAPWTRCDVLGFVADSLEHGVAEADELAELLVTKTHGNPFFVRELVRELVNQGAIHFEPIAGTWRWDKEALRRLPVTDNVVAFLSRRIAGLPADLKDALRVCACLGRELSLADFAGSRTWRRPPPSWCSSARSPRACWSSARATGSPARRRRPGSSLATSSFTTACSRLRARCCRAVPAPPSTCGSARCCRRTCGPTPTMTGSTRWPATSTSRAT
jgi:hypothetical protein